MEPSEQAVPFSEAAREAAARAMDPMYGRRTAIGGTRDAIVLAEADRILTAAVNADPRAKSFLKLAALSDEELVERVARALLSEGAFGDFVPFDDREQIRAEAYVDASAALAALGLPAG